MRLLLPDSVIMLSLPNQIDDHSLGLFSQLQLHACRQLFLPSCPCILSLTHHQSRSWNRADLQNTTEVMAMPSHIRPVSSTLDDGLRILKFVDSQIPFLTKVGSQGQWGSDLMSDDTNKQERYRRMVKRAECQHPWGEDWIRAFIAEVGVEQDALPENLHELARREESTYALPVAAIVLEAHSEDYVQTILPKQDAEDPFIYVRFLVTDRRTGTYSKSAASGLLDHAKSIASALGFSRLCLDCWSGNGRKLVK